MLPLASSLCFFLYAHATDMRQSFDGLSGLMTSALSHDPTNGDVYVFINRRRERVKLLLWERNSLANEQNFIKFSASLVVRAVCERGIEGFR